MDERRGVGQRGEDTAADYLAALGWHILDRNWRSGRLGELDIVAVEPAGPGRENLVFCEVKARTGLGYGAPLEAVTRSKLGRLHRLALAWLAGHQRRCDGIRIDAIGVLFRGQGDPEIAHARGVTLAEAVGAGPHGGPRRRRAER